MILLLRYITARHLEIIPKKTTIHPRIVYTIRLCNILLYYFRHLNWSFGVCILRRLNAIKLSTMKIWIFATLILVILAVFASAQDEDIPRCRPCSRGVSARDCECRGQASKVPKEYLGKVRMGALIEYPIILSIPM